MVAKLSSTIDFKEMFLFYSPITFLPISLKNLNISLKIIAKKKKKIKSRKKYILIYFGSHSSFRTMSSETILTFTCYGTFLLVFGIWESHLYLLFPSYWCRIPTIVWCSYSRCRLVNVFKSKFLLGYLQRDINIMLWTQLTLHFDYA